MRLDQNGILNVAQVVDVRSCSTYTPEYEPQGQPAYKWMEMVISSHF